jgi:hypothetical protein
MPIYALHTNVTIENALNSASAILTSHFDNIVAFRLNLQQYVSHRIEMWVVQIRTD